jgi:hypothetical protein
MVNYKIKIDILFKRSMFFFLSLAGAYLSIYIFRNWRLTIPQPLPESSTITANSEQILLSGGYFEVSIPPSGADRHISADYRLWVPSGVKTLRGLLVKQHGCGGDSLSHADDLQWQALAMKHKFALLGTRLPTDYQTKNRYIDDPCNSWGLIERGSEKAFLRALQKFSQKSNHLELTEVPWALWGHSGGADWVMQMAQKYPARTIAVVLVRGGGVQVAGAGSSLILKSGINQALLQVPTLFALGEKDSLTQEAIELPKVIFERYRKVGAQWAIAIEANAGHETAETRLLAIPFFDAVLSKRLSTKDGSLRAIDANQGWLGSLTTRDIAPVSKYKGNILETAWLPNEETSRKWQKYITTPNVWEQARFKLCSSRKFSMFIGVPYLVESCHANKIIPTLKPMAPVSVRAIKTGITEITLTWGFKPDLENGLPPFRIYRNNSLIATLQGQGYDNVDAPMYSSIILKFRDTKATNISIYNVSAFNAFGESMSQPTLISPK